MFHCVNPAENPSGPKSQEIAPEASDNGSDKDVTEIVLAYEHTAGGDQGCPDIDAFYIPLVAVRGVISEASGGSGCKPESIGGVRGEESEEAAAGFQYVKPVKHHPVTVAGTKSGD